AVGGGVLFCGGRVSLAHALLPFVASDRAGRDRTHHDPALREDQGLSRDRALLPHGSAADGDLRTVRPESAAAPAGCGRAVSHAVSVRSVLLPHDGKSGLDPRAADCAVVSRPARARVLADAPLVARALRPRALPVPRAAVLRGAFVDSLSLPRAGKAHRAHPYALSGGRVRRGVPGALLDRGALHHAPRRVAVRD